MMDDDAFADLLGGGPGSSSVAQAPAGLASNVVEKEHYERLSREAVEKSMEKYRGDLLKVLETLDKRLSGLEQATEKIGLSVGELHTQVGENWNDTTSRLATLENSSHDVGRKVNLLKEKMELTEAQKEMETVSLKEKLDTEKAALEKEEQEKKDAKREEPTPSPAPTSASQPAPIPAPASASPPPPPAPTPPPAPPPSHPTSVPPPPAYGAPPAQGYPPQGYPPQGPQGAPPQSELAPPTYQHPPPPGPHGYNAPPPPQYAPQPGHPQQGGQYPSPQPQYMSPPPSMDPHYSQPGPAPYNGRPGGMGGMGGMGPPPPSPHSGGGPPPSQMERVVNDVARMGFHPDEVRRTVQRIQSSGDKVDMNAVLDKLMR